MAAPLGSLLAALGQAVAERMIRQGHALRRECAGITAGVPQKAADLHRDQKSAALGQKSDIPINLRRQSMESAFASA